VAQFVANARAPGLNFGTDTLTGALINGGLSADDVVTAMINAGADPTTVMLAALVAGADVDAVRRGARAAGVSETLIASATDTRTAGQAIPGGPQTFGTVGVGAAGGGGGTASGQ
jgi:hypothetical protein